MTSLTRDYRNAVFAALLLGFLVIMPWTAQAKKVAVLLSSSSEIFLPLTQGFKQNAQFENEFFNMEKNPDKGRQIVGGFNPGEVSVIVAIGSDAAAAAVPAAPQIPVLYSMLLDPLEPSKPEVYGVVLRIKLNDQLSRIKKLFPDRTRIGVIYTPRYSGKDVNEARGLASAFGVSLFPIAIEDAAEMSNALQKLTPDTVDLLWMMADQNIVNMTSLGLYIKHSLESNLPLIGLSANQVKAGVLMAFSVDLGSIGSQIADKAQKISQHSETRQVENPQKIVVYINSRIQKQLKLGELPALPDTQFIE